VPDCDAVPGTSPALGQLVVVDGPPGAGKSAVARIVATAAPRPTVHLHTDSFYAWIRSGFVRVASTISQPRRVAVGVHSGQTRCAAFEDGSR